MVSSGSTHESDLDPRFAASGSRSAVAGLTGRDDAGFHNLKNPISGAAGKTTASPAALLERERASGGLIQVADRRYASICPTCGDAGDAWLSETDHQQPPCSDIRDNLHRLAGHDGRPGGSPRCAFRQVVHPELFPEWATHPRPGHRHDRERQGHRRRRTGVFENRHLPVLKNQNVMERVRELFRRNLVGQSTLQVPSEFANDPDIKKKKSSRARYSERRNRAIRGMTESSAEYFGDPDVDVGMKHGKRMSRL